MRTLQGNFSGKDVIAIGQFKKSDVQMLFNEADNMRQRMKQGQSLRYLEGKIMASLFYESSTRTASSFSAAMQRLGGGFIPIHDVQSSSVSKGETLSDTIRTLEQYSDIIVLRHPVEGQAHVAAGASSKPLINAGDGVGEHPTQALLDLYTISKECGSLKNLTVTMVGDIKNSRCMHSLAKLLSKYQAKLNYVSPDSLRMPEELLRELAKAGVEQYQTSNLEEAIGQTDVLYVTRAQKERFSSLKEYQAVKNAYNITPAIMKLAPKKMTLIHSLPRVSEIDVSVDTDPRAAYFRQVQNGLYVRMALLNLILGKPQSSVVI